MNETTSSDLDLRLTKANDLIERGKHREALDELWRVEALARGEAEALRQTLDFVAVFGFAASIGASSNWRQPLSRDSAELAELVATLERDVEQQSVARSVAESVGRYWPPSGFSAALLAIFGLGGLGAILGAIIGLRTASCNPQDIVCFSPGDMAFIYAIVFGLAGAGAGLVGSLLVWLLGLMTRPRGTSPTGPGG